MPEFVYITPRDMEKWYGKDIYESGVLDQQTCIDEETLSEKEAE